MIARKRMTTTSSASILGFSVGNGSSTLPPITSTPASLDIPIYLTNSEMKVLGVITLFTGGLSLIGASSVFLCSLINRRVCYPEIFPTFHLSVADMLSSTFLVVSSSIFLLSKSTVYPGSNGPCGYIMILVTCFYTTAFLLTIAYALEALFRFRRRLSDTMRLDAVSVRVVSNNWMYLIYSLCWFIPLGFAVGLMMVTHALKDIHDHSSLLVVMPKQCTSCFPNFRFNEDECWSLVEDGAAKHQMVRLLFLIPLIMVMVINLVLYIMIAKTFRQVAMRRGLLSYHQRQEEGLLRRKAAMYQGVFCLCWLPSVVLGVISFMPGYSMENNYWLLVVQAVLGPLQGILNSILYGWKRDSFRRALSERSSLLSTNRSNTIRDFLERCHGRSGATSPVLEDCEDHDFEEQEGDTGLGSSNSNGASEEHREQMEKVETIEESIKMFRDSGF